jgi:cell wall-associated NlpC family hydrolase
MTAPTAIPDLASIPNRIAAITAQLNAVFIPPSATTSASFANKLSSATSASASDATTTADGSGGVSGNDVVADAQQYLGIPYVFGSESTSGLDCSGLTQKTFADLGVTLPRTAAEQQKVGTPVASLAQAQPGDLLFFGNPAYHVAIYAGDGKLIESPEPGKTVHEVAIYQQPTSISRIVDGAVPSSTAPTGTGLSAGQLTAAGLNPAVARFANQFATAESQFNLPSGMLAAVAQQESGGNPQALSSAGAQGLMQLMPSTAAGIGVNAFDPNQAITAAARILSRNLNEFGGSVPLALAAYNAGAGAVKQYGGIPPYTQTQNYVKSITAMMASER